MKKLLTLLASLSLFLLVACGESTTEKVETEVKKDLESEKTEVEKEKEEIVEESKEESEEESTEETEDINEVIADDDNVKITLINVTKITDDLFGDSIKINFEIENRTDKKILVQSRDISVDGYMADDFSSMSVEITAGKKAKDALTLEEMFLDEGEELPALDESLEMTLIVADDESWEDIASYDVNLEF